MPYGICNLPLIPVKGKPSHRSEWVSQLLFGECFEILDEKNEWLLVRSAHDAYEGWIDGKQQTEIPETFFKCLKQEPQALVDLVAHAPCLKVGFDELVHLLPGSVLPGLKGDSFRIGEVEYLFLGLSAQPDRHAFSDKVEETARFYLNAPYVWGGRSLFGMDCSGFIQIIFKHFGIQLPRDAYQQAEGGDMVDFLQEGKLGDLAFFDSEEGRVDHVGMLLSPTEIIHASGRVKIDRIDEQGIFSSDLNRYTHKLRCVKRMVG